MKSLKRASFAIGLILTISFLGHGVFATIVRPWEAKQALHAGCKIVQHAKGPLPSDDGYFALLDFTRAAWLDSKYSNLALASATLAASPSKMGSLQTDENYQAMTLLIDFCSKEK